MTELAQVSFGGAPDHVVLARIDGEVDSSNAAGVSTELYEGVRPDAGGLILDLAGTHYLDSAGIQAVIALDERLRVRDQRLCLVVPPDSPLVDVLEVGGVGQLVGIAPDVDGAASSLGSDRAS